jgi:hypothetical protein
VTKLETEIQRMAATDPELHSSLQIPANKALGKAHFIQASPCSFTRKLPWSLLFLIIPGKGKLRSGAAGKGRTWEGQESGPHSQELSDLMKQRGSGGSSNASVLKMKVCNSIKC